MAWVTLVSEDGAVTADVQCETPMTVTEAREFIERLTATADELDVADGLRLLDPQAGDNPVEDDPDA